MELVTLQSDKSAVGPRLALAGLLLLLATSAAAAQPPLVQPGAPGEPARQLSAEESVALGQSRYTADDVRFMQHMIVHHAQAVEMGALIPERTETPAVRLMGDRIARSQDSEIAMMRTWLTRRGESTEMAMADHGGHGSHHGPMHGGPPSDTPVMPGMLSPAQMVELAAASGAEFDRLFLTGMIQHHQGALDMVDALLDQPGAGEDPELAEFLLAVQADQAAEIARMRSLLEGE
jgi:uncharacterized protein (DUF305 family)